MLILLSPAKSLDLDTPLPAELPHTLPEFRQEAAQLIEVLRPLAPQQVASLMHLSDALAALNVARYAAWSPRFTAKNARPALLTFNGDVYEGLDARSLSADDLLFAQTHLRILSGLYGVLRPLDLIQPYRLEMGTKLKTDRGANLYQFWGEQISEMLNADMDDSPGETALVNLASKEYFTAVDLDDLDFPVTSPKFLDSRDGVDFRIVSFYAKRARGEMTGWIISERVQNVGDLKAFTGLGYRYAPDLSTDDQPVFTRVNS